MNDQKGVLHYTLEEAQRNNELRRPGITALYEKKRAEQPERNHWELWAETKVAYVEKGERA